eukprot:TRINITY_DN7122_c0_g4_i2.p1 TRINITY_DN7122_c0_g4~~TRINITY_DN7122_c0_g4_i2.p1  ORF type:complete len:595 (-),score=55.52 TRINITY_DN7122_c0_g4_i2:2149-3870(-)
MADNKFMASLQDQVKLDSVDKPITKHVSGIFGLFGWPNRTEQFTELGERPKSFNEKQQSKGDFANHKRSRSYGGRQSVKAAPKKKDIQGTSEAEKQGSGESSFAKASVMGCFSIPAADSIDTEDLIQTQDPILGAPNGMVGIYNLGNTCFINTAIQCLRCTPYLVQILLPDLDELPVHLQIIEGQEQLVQKSSTVGQSIDTQPILHNNPGLQGGSNNLKAREEGEGGAKDEACMQIIPASLEENQEEAQNYKALKVSEVTRLLLVQLIKGESLSVVKPIQLYKKLFYSTLFNDFCDKGQHDCSEFFRQFLQQIHQDLNRVEQKFSKDISQHHPDEQKNESEVDKADREFQQFLAQEHSPLSDLFMGQIQNVTICNKCNNRSTKYEPFWELNVPLAKESKGGISSWFSSKVPQSIEDTLKAFVSEEVVDGRDAVVCEQCNQKTSCTRYSRIHKFPQIIVLTLKRFKWIEGCKDNKIKIHISAPLIGLDLNPYRSHEISEGDGCVYDLYAVCNHSGESSTTGHYTAVCKITVQEGDEQWVMFNDDKVSIVQRNEVVTAFAYMFFYKSRRSLQVAL